MIKRGDVYYIVKKNDVCDSEQRAGRPAVVVSNDKANEHSDVVEVVYFMEIRRFIHEPCNKHKQKFHRSL